MALSLFRSLSCNGAIVASVPATAVACLRGFGSHAPSGAMTKPPQQQDQPRINAKIVSATSDHLVSAVDPAPAQDDVYTGQVLRDYADYRKRATSFGF